MNILVINGNTTQAITDRVAATARAFASSGTKILAVTAETGPRVIATRTENLLGAHAVLTLAARYHANCDAAVIAVSTDTGLRAVREALPIPVVGMTEAALLLACALGDGIGFLAIGRRSSVMYRETIASHGMTARVTAFEAIDAPPEGFANPSGMATPILGGIEALAKQGADTAIIAGAAFAGIGSELRDRTPIPIVDGVGAAVRLAEALVGLGVGRATSGGYTPLPRREIIGVDPAINNLFGAP
jgi:allantoin racemase